MPLLIDGTEVESVLHLKDESTTFIFQNINEEPVVSLFREFSSPVKLEFDQSDEDLALLMVHEENLFARWNASQELVKKHIIEMVEAVKNGSELTVDSFLMETFRNCIKDHQTDPALIAEIITIPAESEIAGWFDVVPVDEIHEVVSTLGKEIAIQLESEMLNRYKELTLPEYTIAHDDIAKRTLRNKILHFLAHTSAGEELVKAQYDSADNMTDTIAALSSAVESELNVADELLNHFSDKWNSDGLVMDKWFIIQATAPAKGTLGRVKDLMANHNSFDFSNPNRVRSLIGGFAMHNQIAFHAVDGSGYQFIADQLEKLNSSNPQVAARLIDPLLKLKRYDSVRQKLIREQLVRLSKLDNLAKDLYEKITKALDM